MRGRPISAGLQLQMASFLQYLPCAFSITSFAVLLTQPSAAVDTDGRQSMLSRLYCGFRTSQKKWNFMAHVIYKKQAEGNAQCQRIMEIWAQLTQQPQS